MTSKTPAWDAVRREREQAEKVFVEVSDASRIEERAARLRAQAQSARSRADAAEQLANMLDRTPGVDTVGDLMDKAEREGDAETMALIRQAFG